MKKTLLFLTSLVFSFEANSQQYTELFLSGGTETDVTVSVIESGENESISIGMFSGTCSFDGADKTSNGLSDIFIVNKPDNSETSWIKTFGGAGNDYVTAVVMDAANDYIYVSGSFSQSVTFGSTTLISKGSDDGFVLCLDGSGNVMWVKQIGGIGFDKVSSVAIIDQQFPLQGQDLVICGNFSSRCNFGTDTVLISSGNTDGFVAKVNTSSGEFMNAVKFGGTSLDMASKIASISDDEIIVVGSFLGTSNFSGTNLTSLGNSDVCLLKYNANLNLTFAKRFGGTSADFSTALSIIDGNSSYICMAMQFQGTSSLGGTSKISGGGSDVLIGAFDFSGNAIWDFHVKGTGNESVVYISPEFGGATVLFLGNFNKHLDLENGNIEFDSNGGTDYFYCALDAEDGTLYNANSNGGIATDAVYGGYSDGTIVRVCGVYSGQASFINSDTFELWTTGSDSGKGDSFCGKTDIGF